MITETNIEKLARLYTEDGFTKEEMAKEMFSNGLTFADVVKVGLLMKGELNNVHTK